MDAMAVSSSTKRLSNRLVSRLLAIAILSSLTVFAGGCGDDGVYKVSGSVNFKGKPVPSGEIRFTPDKGNKGPMVLARIKEGKYETPKDKGVVGGAYQLRVTGYAAAGNSKDPSAPDFGKQLFKTYREEVDFPKEDSEHNIEID